MRLLLCEDEVELSDGLVAILKHNNYSVDAVYDGAEALDYLEAIEYDGVILDIMLPKVDGLSVLKQIRSNGNQVRSEEHTSELQSRFDLVCRLLLEKKKNKINQ